MYFPEDMTFQYFFFDTYIGYFLQALPIALIAGTIYGLVKFRKDKETPIIRKVLSCAFVCYMTGLICLVIGFEVLGIFWYELLFHMKSSRTINFFSGDIYLVPDFFNNISSENIGNFLMFLPFGFLHPLSKPQPTWNRTVGAGLVTVIIIEVLQPVFGRAFDINDIILNSLGIIVSTSVFMLIKKMVKR